MGYKSGFNDNQSYNSNDINEIYQKMFGAGVVALDLQDYVDYQNSKLNIITNGVVQNGVVPSSEGSLKVVASGSNVKISQGMAFFNDGSYFIADSDGVTFTPTAGMTNYVYLKRDSVANGSAPYCSTSAPWGDYVELAQFVSVDSITDKRIYCRGKLPMYGSSFNLGQKYSVTTTGEGTLEITGSNFKYIILTSRGTTLDGRGYSSSHGVYDISANTYLGSWFYVYDSYKPFDLYITGGLPVCSVVQNYHLFTVRKVDNSYYIDYGGGGNTVTFDVYAV